MFNSRYKQLAGDMGIFVVGTVLAKAIQFLLMPLYTSYMTTTAYGTAELTNNLSELLFPLVTLCVYEAAFRYAVDPKVNNGEITKSVTRILGISMILGLTAAIFIKLVFHYKFAYYLYFVLYAYSFRMCAAYYVRGKGLSKEFAISGIVNALALGLFNVLFLVVLSEGERGYLISLGASYITSGIYLLFRGKIKDDLKGSTYNKETNELLLKYGIPLIFYNILYWFTTISGRYILLWFTDASTAGLYVAAIKISAVINMLQQAIYAAFQLNTSQTYEESEDKEAYYSSVVNSFTSLYAIFGSMMICLAPLIAKITLRGEFYSAKIYLPLIMFSAIIFCISSLLGALYSTYKMTKRKIGVSLTGAFVNILAGIILAPKFGIWGVCIASALCYISQAIYMVIDVDKFCHITYKKKNILIDLAALAAVAGLMTLTKGIIPPITITSLLLIFHASELKAALKKIN